MYYLPYFFFILSFEYEFNLIFINMLKLFKFSLFD